MKQAFEEVLRVGSDHNQTYRLYKAKLSGRFAGSMRTNLVKMLDSCALAETLGLKSSEELFDPNINLLHTTSVIKYPVFYESRNYTGHKPKMMQSNLLYFYATQIFPMELRQIPEGALVIPLGKMVENVFETLQADNKLPMHTYMCGMPHPSGANGHRRKQFFQNQKQLENVIRKWVEA